MLCYVPQTKKCRMEPNYFRLKTSELCQIIGGQFINEAHDHNITSITIDSRTALGHDDEVFFAFKGNHLDGHLFIEELYQKGTRNFVVERRPSLAPEANVILVDDVLHALQKTAQFKRALFIGTVVGITGSNGKTIVKEWLATILETSVPMVKSPGSYNSQIGVALSLWQLNNKYKVGIFEAGISKPKEMEVISKLLNTQIGIFTNIGPAHQENFDSIEQKITEKLKLFNNSSQLIIRSDDDVLLKLAEQQFKGELITWTFDKQRNDHIKVTKQPSGISFKFNSKEYTFKVPFQDDGSLENLTHSIIAAILLRVSEKDIQSGINQIQPLKIRLMIIQGINGNFIIDDSYTNDLGGLKKALNFMAKENLQKSKVIILSDFGSANTLDQYTILAKLLKDKNVNQFIGIGEGLISHQNLFPDSSLFFNDTDTFLSHYPLESLKDRLILVKGSRKFQFEKIVNRLSQHSHKTCLEINLDSVVKNLSIYKRKLQPKTKIMVMVKALAYGSGSFEIAKILEYHKVDYLAVAYTDEGKELREKGIRLPIMVMNPSLNDGPDLAKYNLEPEVFSINQIKSFQQDFNFEGKKLPIHIILNTGMNRLGFDKKQLPELNSVLLNQQGLEVKSIFTHLAAADEDQHKEFTENQAEEFKLLAERVQYRQTKAPLKHILNSSGIAKYPDYQMDMVRLGIGLYGLDPTNSIQNELVYPSTFKTTISQIRDVRKGESIGYGRKGMANKDSKIATIAVGYADGYSRRFGNGRASVSINKQLAQTVGNICMDMSMVDVTDIEAKEGDEVILFGAKPTIQDLAKIAETIPYEILTNVSSRVKRIFFAE